MSTHTKLWNQFTTVITFNSYQARESVYNYYYYIQFLHFKELTFKTFAANKIHWNHQNLTIFSITVVFLRDFVVDGLLWIQLHTG